RSLSRLAGQASRRARSPRLWWLRGTASCTWLATPKAGSGRSFHVSLPRLAQLEVGPLDGDGSLVIEAQHAVDPHLACTRVDAEGIAIPKHYVSGLAGLEAADLSIDPERTGRIERDPSPGFATRNVQPRVAAREHALCGLLVQPLN